MAERDFLETFKVPPVAYNFVDQMVTEVEQRFLARMAGKEFTAPEVVDLVSELRGEPASEQEAAMVLRQGYKRGSLNLLDEERMLYAVSDFFVRLDVFSVTETEVYRRFPKEVRRQLNTLYLERYVGGLDRMADTPTLDEVVPLEELTERIERDERQIYLSPCDCRALAGECEKPTLTCLSYRTVPGSYASR
ncbi:hypothetical protein LJC49_08605, partial [Ruminococcaceae bacterium OttesenSCG-928-I18]|nr:hypothetical protein [Ruminococcaceae bacterium OttesenSCG-928-I18]